MFKYLFIKRYFNGVIHGFSSNIAVNSTSIRAYKDRSEFKKVRRLVRNLSSLILIIVAFILRFRKDGLVDSLLIIAIVLDIISILLDYKGGERCIRRLYFLNIIYSVAQISSSPVNTPPRID